MEDFPKLVEATLKLYSELYGFQEGEASNMKILQMLGIGGATIEK